MGSRLYSAAPLIGGTIGGLGGAGLGYKFSDKDNKVGGAIAGGLTGAYLGVRIGSEIKYHHNRKAESKKFWDDFYKKRAEERENWNKQRSGFGAGFGRKDWDDMFREAFGQKQRPGGGKSYSYSGRQRYSGGQNYGSSSTRTARPQTSGEQAFDSFLKTVKTKADANKRFRDEMLRTHPDKGGSQEEFVAVKQKWDNFKSYGGFNKLAYLLFFKN